MTKLQKITENFSQIGQGIGESVQSIIDKTGRASAALSAIKVIKTDEQDEDAKKLLVKVRNTFQSVQAMRKEITDPLDSIKSELIEFEKKISTAKASDSEYQRVKKLRDQYASYKEEQARKEQARIQREKDIRIHEAEIKSSMQLAVEEEAAKLLEMGMNHLNGILLKLTVDNFELEMAKLNYKPTLKHEVFLGWLDVDYNKDLISNEQFDAIKQAAAEHFDFDKVASTYSDSAVSLLNEFKNVTAKERLTKLVEIEELRKVNEHKAAEAEKKAEEHEKLRREEEKRIHERQKELALEKVKESRAEEMLDAEFESQVQIQQIESQKGVRRKISYAIDPEFEKNKVKVIDVMMKVITHVMASTDFKGIHKRDSSGFPKLDDKGNAQYVDGIDYWLKEMSKLKIDADHLGINGLKKTIETTTIQS